MSAAVIAAVGLGGNVGDVRGALASAIAALGELPGTRLLRASQCYRTPAWGVEAQPDFINAAAMLETTLTPRALLAALLEIERGHGRTRAEDGSRWGPRTLDLDLLVHGQARIDEPGLVVPHPHLHVRAFVLVPLAEIAPGLDVPGRGCVRELLHAVDVSGVVPLEAGGVAAA
jgi:2-amino-4-hydroxy-6-hydroxymethyldihydropteridine diphosphokinase